MSKRSGRVEMVDGADRVGGVDGGDRGQNTVASRSKSSLKLVLSSRQNSCRTVGVTECCLSDATEEPLLVPPKSSVRTSDL